MKNVKEQSKKLREFIDAADGIILGIGNGLFQDSFKDFGSKELIKEWMPLMAEKGYKNIIHAMRAHYWFDEDEASEYWSFWAPYIKRMRYETELLPGYQALYELVKDKEYFLITTAFDGQWDKAGFSKDRVLAYNGDAGYNQCYVPCTFDRYYNEKEIYKMTSHMTEIGSIRQDYLSRCPKCGNYLVPNIRTEENFVAEPYLGTKDLLNDVLKKLINKNVLFLEIGEGFDQPGFIRYPFEEMTKQFEHGVLVRLNEKDPDYPEELKDKIYIMDHNISEILIQAVKI
ncbi:MAG: hypothetical protein Q4Q07_05180 [Tissierellia bacterium]|nr:hypothetical protein [Tissierellia bacterium]